MADDKKTGINDVLAKLFFEEGCISIADKSLSSFADADKARLNELIGTQKNNLDKAFEFYKQLSPLLDNINLVGEEIRKITNNFIDVHSDVNQNEVNINEAVAVTPSSGAVIDEPTMVSVEVPEMVAINSGESAEANMENNVMSVENGEDTTVSDEKPEMENAASSFVLSPIDDGIVNADTPEDTPNVAENNNELPIQQDEAAEVVNENVTSESVTTEEVGKEKYTRTSQNDVKAILVTNVQYEKLNNSKAVQKELVNGSSLNAESTPIVSVGEETVNAATTDQLQTMIEQANALYKEGKTQEAQELFNKISAMNKEIQPVSNAGGVELVKK